MVNESKIEATTEIPIFTKEQLRNSRKYRNEKDILGVVLEDGKDYTIEETDKLIKDFKERKVK